MQTYESDVCVVGGGISAALISQKLSELAPDATVTVLEAGDRFFDLRARSRNRRRWLDYRENAWPGDFIEDQEAEGMISRTMAVGGSALHWGAVCNRFSREDLELRSRYGLAVDWPIEWAEFERFTCEAERRLGVQGEEAPYPEDRPSAPYPMPPMPLSYNLQQLKRWAQESGIRFQGTPEAKNTVPYDGRSVCMRCNTCSVCPTGARYSPDFTFRRLLDENRLTLHDRTLIRKLIPDESGSRIVAARGLHRDRPGQEEVEYRAPLFVIASGYVWSSHLLLLSANSRFPDGLANRSGLVGRYMTGHAFISAFMETDTELYPGMMSHSLVSREFFRCPSDNPFRAARPAGMGERARAGDRDSATTRDRSCWGMNCWTTGDPERGAGWRAFAPTTTCIPTGTARSLSTRPGATATGIRCPASSIGSTSPPRPVRPPPRNRFWVSSAGSPAAANSSTRSTAPTSIIPAAAAGWERTPPTASATASEGLTTTRTCSWWEPRRCRPAAARTAH